MIPFVHERGVAVAMPAANIDTDVIMPKTFLKGTDRSGLDRGLFHDLRFDDAGDVRQDFVLNRQSNVRFLLVGPNFGCGSSREHAVWGMLQYGIRAIIGTSFAGIFADNAKNNGLLLVTLTPEALTPLVARAQAAPAILAVDLENRKITMSNVAPLGFEIDPARQRALMLGLDQIGETLQEAEHISRFQEIYLANNAWLVETAA
ncbi:3-isopropylmalate dehydratase small subunit [Sphingomonas sp. PAMC 26621]|uniref:3-isopropylmalate dehydratase small subunit n=1 Tax=Sphingomonas sp. PAMC 26621 TaxID=1112213 RepID=UPI0002890814|nr:3-isopropylmalate dehydratase small subunit [Sphingomonas sp. PAMC 26621]